MLSESAHLGPQGIDLSTAADQLNQRVHAAHRPTVRGRVSRVIDQKRRKSPNRSLLSAHPPPKLLPLFVCLSASGLLRTHGAGQSRTLAEEPCGMAFARQIPPG